VLGCWSSAYLDDVVSFFSGFIQRLVQPVWENMKDPDYAWGFRTKKEQLCS